MNGVDWRPLDQELEHWSGRALPLWWRDDDAIEPTPALDRLLALTADLGATIAIATIPAHATPALAARLAQAPHAVALPHGARHVNHAPEGEKKAEFGPHRPPEAMAAEIGAGWRNVQALFGAQARPLFTPPWNRIAPALIPLLPAQGLTGLSTYGPRAAPEAAPGLIQINTHLDPIDWHGTRSLASPEWLIGRLAKTLARRRSGETDASEPLGLLTHHLVHDEAIWGFCDALVRRLAAGARLEWFAPPT